MSSRCRHKVPDPAPPVCPFLFHRQAPINVNVQTNSQSPPHPPPPPHPSVSVPVSSSNCHRCQGADKLSVGPLQSGCCSFILKMLPLSRCRQTFSRAPPVCPLQFHRQNVTVVKVQTNFQSGPSSLSVAVSSSKCYRCQGADKLSVGPLQSVRSDFIVRQSSLSRCRQTFSRAPPVCQFQFHRPTVIAVKVQTQIPLDPTPCPFLFRRQPLSLSGPRPNFHQN